MNGTKINSEPLVPEEAIDFVSTEQTGGISVFVGSVRNKNREKEVIGLHYQAYDGMVINEMETAVMTARKKWDLKRIFTAHRKGDLKIGDVAIVVACSSVHRKEAIEATSWLVDELKSKLPIWKKEIYKDGSEWLNDKP